MTSGPVRDTESYAEEVQSFDPDSDGGWVIYESPCPECGGEEFLEVTRHESVVTLDEDGDGIHMDPRQHAQKTEKVMCRGCDTTLYEA